MGLNKTFQQLKTDDNDPIKLAQGIYYAENDDELTEVVNQAPAGSSVYLGANNFTRNRTFEKGISLIGTGNSVGGQGTQMNDPLWKFNAQSHVRKMRIGGKVVLNAARSSVIDCGIQNARVSNEVVVSASKCILRGLTRGDAGVLFESGTESGIIHGCANDVPITDNGSNTIGNNG